tara:strand:+ start:19375 stop:21300 length:1926 start_codon:yes stop_codon:yes gene_type:complete
MERKYTLFLIVVILFINNIFAQIPVSDIKRLSNTQLDLIRQELQSNANLDVVGQEEISEDITTSPETVNITSSANDSDFDNRYFGYNYFRRDINFFDNIPTPSDFRLGPGDEIILSLWGETNLRESFSINKDGMIYYENVGFINLSGKTIKNVESVLVNKLSQIYSTLTDENNSTKLKVELGSLKSINVYFTGQIQNPGINLIHPFSDIFSAIIQAGGINDNGSLRNIKLIRNGGIVSSFDFYSFFVKGKNNFSDIRILDGDVIHIPEVLIRAEMQGEILQEGFFELLDNESIFDLIDYAGGLSKDASSYAVLDMIIPATERSSDDNARISMNINLKEPDNIKVTNGSTLNIIPIGQVETKVTVLGRVKLPGEYSASSTLKEVLNIAGGFDDPLYRKTIRDDLIIVARKDEKQFYGSEFQVSYAESDSFNLIPGDKIFVYENPSYNNLFSVSVAGEVNKRGTFQLKKGMTIEDAIILAEGFTPLANQDAINVTESFTSTNDLGIEITEIRPVNDANLDFEISDGSIINVLPLENVVSVQGNVYNPGLVTYNRGKTVNKYINLAGGPKPNTLSTKIYVKRANGRIKKVTFLQGIGTIVKPGDTIFVPVDDNPTEFDITTFIADLASTLANIAAILIIVDNND